MNFSARFAWIVAYSGISRELTKSGFNVRVQECHQAAAELLPNAKFLSDVPREVFDDRKMRLPENLRKRATHFYTEVERVQQGAKAWYEANLEVYGHLMNASCESSIKNYESGSDILIELHELVSGSDSVYGSRFSGGGYGGCVVALVQRAAAENICARVAKTFTTRHPELPSRYSLPKREMTAMIKSAVLLAAGRGKRQRCGFFVNKFSQNFSKEEKVESYTSFSKPFFSSQAEMYNIPNGT